MKKKEIIVVLLLILALTGALRFYKILNIPPGIHGDELGIAYNAYSLLKTGRDEYGKLWPLTFRNDFTPAIVYLTIPFVWLLGLSEIAVRLPTSIISVLIIPLLFLVVIEITKNKKISLLTIFLLAISSWDIRIARIGVGITLALFFQLLGIIFYFRAFYKSKENLVFSFLFFSLSLFSYQTPKLTTPLLILLLVFLYRIEIKLKKNIRWISALFIFFIVLPSIVYLIDRPLSTTRFAGISVFTLWRSELPKNSSLTNYIEPRNIFYLFSLIFSNYIKHFDPFILFIDNSMLRYHELKNQGLFYLWESVFILIGFISYLFNLKDKQSKLFFGWLLISPIPSALTTGVPNSNISRALMMLPIIIIFASKGILVTLNNMSLYLKKYITYLIIILSVISLIYFNKSYFINQDSQNTKFWGHHLKVAALIVGDFENSVDKIILSNTLSPQNYMYILFYNKKEPAWLLKNAGEYKSIVGYSSIGKYEFRDINWENDKHINNALIIGLPGELPQEKDITIREIMSVDGEVLLRINKTSK